MKSVRDKLAIAVIYEWATKLEQERPELEPDMLECLEQSFMKIGKILTDELERKDEHEKERSVSG